MTNLLKFSDFRLSDSMLKSLEKKGFSQPTPIQAKTIPFLLENKKDLIGKAQTGTGKTAAFGIPLIENLEQNSKKIQAIILAPTRELAMQVAEELSSFTEEKKTRIAVVYGGQPIDRQISILKRGVDIVVGTPGRVIDHLERKTIDISKVSYVILDEADEMLNMGFIEDIEKILQSAPKKRRTVLFSATMPSHIEKLAKNYMSEYEVISVAEDQNSKENIRQIYFEVSPADKFEALFRIIDVEQDFYGMIFCRTKIDTDEIAHKLSGRGCKSEALHGDVSQAQREKILQKFRTKKINILVATDVAARGIDVDNLTHVINYSLPQDPESYVHRIGRTGRAGKSGIAATLISSSEFKKLLFIQKIAKGKINKEKIPATSDVINVKRQRILKNISEIITNNSFDDMISFADEIIASKVAKPEIIIAAMMKLAFKEELNEKNYKEIQESSGRRVKDSFRSSSDFNQQNSTNNFTKNRNFNRKDFDRGDSDRKNFDRKDSVRLFIAKGKDSFSDVRSLVDFVQKESGVEGRKIDDVKLFDSFSFFAVSSKDAEKILDNFQKKSNGKRPIISYAKAK